MAHGVRRVVCGGRFKALGLRYRVAALIYTGCAAGTDGGLEKNGQLLKTTSVAVDNFRWGSYLAAVVTRLL